MEDWVAYALVILGIVAGWAGSWYFGRQQQIAAERDADENRRTNATILEEVQLYANEKLKPLGPAISKAVVFSVIHAGAVLGWDNDPRTLLTAVEREDPVLMRAWVGQVPDENARETLVAEVVKVALDLKSRDVEGLHLSGGTTVPYDRVIETTNLPPFSRLALLSRSKWWDRLTAAVVLAGVFATLVLLPILLYVPPLFVWPLWLPVIVAGLTLDINYIGKKKYRDECVARWEYHVLFAPGHFLSPPTMVAFGNHAPAGIFVPDESGFGMVRVIPKTGFGDRHDAGAVPTMPG
jgi:hypothetical protein